MEITIIIIEMDINEENLLAMEKYKALTEEYYQGPMDQKFPIPTESINF